jgi:hypothetical protein
VRDVIDTAAEQIARLRVLWPVLNSRPEHTQEIVQAIRRHVSRLKPEDVEVGFSNAIENAPTNGWPPGPHEILGSVLKAAETRRAITTTPPRRYAAGLTFSEWWHSLPERERPRHQALARIMGAGTGPDLAEVDEW